MLIALSVLGGPAVAAAGCCRVVRIDPAPITPLVRVCEPDTDGGCGTVLFEGALEAGAASTVCATGNFVVYQDADLATGGYGPTTQARCDGVDVQL